MGKKRKEWEPLRANFSPSRNVAASGMAITAHPHRLFAARNRFKMRLRSVRLIERFQRYMVQQSNTEC